MAGNEPGLSAVLIFGDSSDRTFAV